MFVVLSPSLFVAKLSSNWKYKQQVPQIIVLVTHVIIKNVFFSFKSHILIAELSKAAHETKICHIHPKIPIEFNGKLTPQFY
jgi:hypothetical protein